MHRPLRGPPIHSTIPSAHAASVRSSMRRCASGGVAGLRAIDASVFPEIPQAMVNAAVIAVAEQGSDLVLEN